MNRALRCIGLISLWLLAACGDGSDDRASSDAKTPPTPHATSDAAQPSSPTPYRTSSRNLVQWKRAAALEADLMRALDLSRDELCRELGDKNCIRDVHLVPLGGNEPYVAGLMKPSSEPLATTSSVIDRVLLSACSTRARMDAENKPKVFQALAFDRPLPAASAAPVTDTVRDLYRRLLARDPEPSEIAQVASLAESTERDDEPLSARDFAALACFTIGSTTEFLFF